MATSLQQDRTPPQFLFLVPRRPERKAMNGLGARPNVYRRSLEARDFTNAYLAEVERKATWLDEPTSQRTERLATYLTAGIVIALVLFAIGLRVL